VRERLVLAMLLLAAMTPPAMFSQSGRTSANGRFEDMLVPIKENGLWGYANQEGKVVIKAQLTVARRFSEGLALVWTGGIPLTDSIVKTFVKMGYIDQTGRWVFHSRFEYYFFDDFSEGLVPFRQQFGKWGYMDRNGKIAIRPGFDWAGSFSQGLAVVVVDERCGHIDESGKIVDQSQTVLPRQKYEQDRHGTYRFRLHSPPCS